MKTPTSLNARALLLAALTATTVLAQTGSGADKRVINIQGASAGNLRTGPLNFTGYTSDAINEGLDTLRTTTDLAERQGAVAQISMDISENLPNLFTGYTLTDVAVRDVVKNVDGWTFPDGSEGDGVPGAQAMWGFVWTTE